MCLPPGKIEQADKSGIPLCKLLAKKNEAVS